ncbi:hypothetical protein [Clostridium sp. HCS.1]|uniref:hypothetical protein n=1 Tax=Clostridium sp. HCS.1 TaxID=3238594 RepID=UPI003A0FF384
MLSKEIITLKYNISLNNYEISILKKKIETLDSAREKYLKKLKDLVIDKNYKDYCFTCKEGIDSSDEFCIRCGWLKCSWCKSCGCNYGSSSVNKKYKKNLRNNYEAQILKEKLDKIYENKSLYNGNCNKMENENDLFKKKLKQFVKSGVKNET